MKTALIFAICISGMNARADDALFETKIRPLLADRCIKCHGPQKQSGGLRLDSSEAMNQGGDSGPPVVAAKPGESLLMRAIRREDDVAAMPPNAPLPSDLVAALEQWIRDGARWPEKAAPVLAAKHWAYEPIRSVEPPSSSGHPIDAFLNADQTKRNVTPVAAADKRTLIRRAAFDLTGLPPSPEVIDAFENDHANTAFATVVDRLLASPQYGEKWGRMWLDVARYADTAGETADIPVPDAWRYRNYVIRAFNDDKPYDQFLREQLAGDILASEMPDDAPAGRYADLVTATGYLAVSRRFGFDIAKDHYLTIDDTIDTLGKSVLGLTIGCARCHDHKYDAIRAKDYYALYGIFESTRYPFTGCEKDRAPRDLTTLVSSREKRQRIEPLEAKIASAAKALEDAEKNVARSASESPAMLASGDIPNGGKHEISASTVVRKGQMIRLTIAPKNGHGADSTFVNFTITEQTGEKRSWNATRDMLPDLFQKGTGFQHDDAQGNNAVWHVWDDTPTPRLLTTFENDAERTKGLAVWRGIEPTPCLFGNINDHAIAFVTVKQPARSLALHPGPNSAAVLAWESPIDGDVVIAANVEDIDPTGGDGVGWSVAVGPGLGIALSETIAPKREHNLAKRDLDAFAATLPSGFAMAEGSPHNARVLIKGDPETLGDEVPRGFLRVLGEQPVTSGSGRRELADWIASESNPLTARVFVNRVWQGHFGKGLVQTPDNFGVRGEPPTHPELLDWLTAKFLRDGWSVKQLHRAIMLSNAYQRSSSHDDANARNDPENLSLWKFPRRRLTAEEIRDAMLSVSGDLDPSPGEGHPFPASNTWQFTQHNPFSAVYDHNRRSVYLMTQRIKRHPFLALFDGPDTNSSIGKRDSTIVPTQALFFLNDPFVHARAASLAEKLAALPDDRTRLDRACRLLYGRPANATDQRIAERFKGNWPSLLRVMFWANEFLFVD